MTEHRKRRVSAIVAVLAAGAIATTSALYTDTEMASDNTLRSGVLDLSVDRQSTVITAANMAPGDVLYEAVMVTNSGDIALTYNTVVSLSDSDGLEEKLNVSTVAGAPTRDGEGAAAGTPVQTINGFTSPDDTSTSAPGQDRPLAPGDSEELLLVVELDRDAQLDLSGKTATVVWTFTGTMVETPTGPTHAPDTPVAGASPVGLDEVGSALFTWEQVATASDYEYRYAVSQGPWSEVSTTGGDTRALITGQDPGVPLSFEVRAVNEIGPSAWSATVETVTSVDAVDPAVAGATPTSFTVTWPAVAGATSYEFQQRVNSGAWSAPATTDGTSVTIPVTSISQNFDVQVRAVFDATTSAWSESVAGHGLTAVPAASIHRYEDTQATLRVPTVTKATSVEYQYRINGGEPVQGVRSVTFVDVTGFASGSLIEVRARSVSAMGASAWSEWSGASSSLAAPTGLQQNMATSLYNRLNLNWTTVAGAPNYFVEYQKPGNSTWWGVGGTLSSGNAMIMGLLADTEYPVRVSTYDSNGVLGPASPVVIMRTPTS